MSILRLAASLPVGSPERRQILAQVVAKQRKTARISIPLALKDIEKELRDLPADRSIPSMVLSLSWLLQSEVNSHEDLRLIEAFIEGHKTGLTPKNVRDLQENADRARQQIQAFAEKDYTKAVKYNGGRHNPEALSNLLHEWLRKQGVAVDAKKVSAFVSSILR